jgi:uncharacterized protein YdhG (YjbR/CyaY superfamily)
MASKPKTIDQYLAALGDERRAALEKLRKSIRAAAPKAQECISYGLPAFQLDQKPLVAFGATAKHCAFYLLSGSIVERHQDELKNCDTSKGSIRFQPDKPPPTALVRKLVKARIAETRISSQEQPTQNQVHYHKDGTVWAKGMTVQGVPTGYWEWFRKDGTRLRSGHFDNGKQVGEWITYDQQGRKYKVTRIKPKPAKA